MPEVSPTTLHDILLGGERGICLLGFSCRALAEACVTVNLPVSAVDCFADRDLCELTAQWQLLEHWDPNLLLELISESHSQSASQLATACEAVENPKSKALMLLAGGTENWAPWLEQLRDFAPILGPDSKQLQKLRDLEFWQDLARRVDGLNLPETAAKPELAESRTAPATSARWLRKSISSSGGLGVRPAMAEELDASGGGDHYFQSEVRGRVLGACLILPPTPQECELVGVTESWTERDWPGPSEFIYRGSFGPIPLSQEQDRILLDLAETVRQQIGLRGWLGVDFIEDAGGNLWLLELNPRWTAGMEILARTGRNPVPAHLACFTPDLSYLSSQPQIDAPGADSQTQTCSLAAKAVVYAEREVRLGAQEIAVLHKLPRRNFADIPRLPDDSPELVIEPGHPILTVRCDRQKLTNPREELLLHLRHLHQQLRDQIPGC